MPDNPRSYSTSEVAKRLGISTQTVQRWVDTGQLKAWKTLGGHRRVEAEGAELLFRLHGLTTNGAPRDATADPQMGHNALSVLVVDDNPDDRDILVHLVEEAYPSANVAVATNGFHGLIAIGRMAPDVVISDLLMPHMNGFEMLRHLTTGCAVKPLYILAVSSNKLADLAQKGTLPHGVAFLKKPFEPDVFIKAIRAGVEMARAEQQRPA